MIDYINGWTAEQLKHSRDHFEAVGCVCVICAPILETLCAELARREGEPMGEGPMKVKAKNVQLGDLIDGQRVTLVIGMGGGNIMRFGFDGEQLTTMARYTSELVEVERPIKTVTITVELSQDEVHHAATQWMVEGHHPRFTLRAKVAAACADAEAVRKAQA